MTLTPPPPSSIPQSSALAEADPLSLNLLMSLDPEDPTFVEGLPRIVRALREQAERFAAAEANGKRAPKAQKAIEPPSSSSAASIEELGF